jgi:hypothetical protein
VNVRQSCSVVNVRQNKATRSLLDRHASRTSTGDLRPAVRLPTSGYDDVMTAGAPRSNRRSAWLDIDHPGTLLRIYLSDVAIVAAGITFATVIGTGWSWPFFVWGLAIGSAMWAFFEITAKATPRLFPLNPDDRPRLAAHHHRYRIILFPTALALGLFMGTVSAALRTPAFDVIGTAALVLFGLMTSFILVMLPRKIANRRPPPAA